MNFEMAKDMAEMDDIAVDFVVVDDDIALLKTVFTQRVNVVSRYRTSP